MQEGKRRIHMLDEIRGLAILCMVVHHTLLDIGDVLGLSWGYDAFEKLKAVQPIFWMAFIIISGMCTRLSRNPARRGALVLVFAAGITLVTCFIMPRLGYSGMEIWFGILHCLGVCMVVAGLLMPLIKKIDYRVGASVCAALFALTYGIDSKTMLFGLIRLPDSLYRFNAFAPLGFYGKGFFSADYFPLLPWIFVFLFGAFVGQLATDECLPETMYKKRSKLLSFVGRNSLWVYVAHQPVIYAVLWVVSEIIVFHYSH